MMKNQDTCCFYLVSCPCRARDRAAITFIHNDDDLHFLASERMDLTNAKQNKYIFIFKKREEKRLRDDRLWILCRWDRKRQQASKTQWDHFGRRHWIRNTLSTRYRSLEKGCLCAEECIFIVVVIADNVERAKEWALFFIKPEEKNCCLLSGQRSYWNWAEPQKDHIEIQCEWHIIRCSFSCSFDFQKWYCHWITIVFSTIA